MNIDKKYESTLKELNSKMLKEIEDVGNYVGDKKEILNSEITKVFPGHKNLKDLLNSKTLKEEDILEIEEEIKKVIKSKNPYSLNTKDWFNYQITRAAITEEYKESTQEIILVIEHHEIIPKSLKEGFNEIKDLSEILVRDKHSFIQRSFAEYNPKLKQPIPYILIRSGDKYFFIKREGKSGEERLINKMGLVSGHIGFDKEDFKNIYEKEEFNLFLPMDEYIVEGLYRELEEEVGIKKDSDIIDSLTLEGIIYNDSGVNADHIGLFYILDLNTTDIDTMEEGVISGGWFNREDLIENKEFLEDWAKIIVESFIE